MKVTSIGYGAPQAFEVGKLAATIIIISDMIHVYVVVDAWVRSGESDGWFTEATV